MAEKPLIIQEEQFIRLKKLLEQLCVSAAARVVLLIDRDGQPIAHHGEIKGLDTTSFASLAAGNVAATNSMARLLGEEIFPTVVHEGERESIYICIIGRSLLVVVFDDRSTIGLVKLRTKKVSYDVAALMDEIVRESAKESEMERSIFTEITDDDIDSLFS